jgi:predicted neutral ceramidase superfamily lipid hydrolase
MTPDGQMATLTNLAVREAESGADYSPWALCALLWLSMLLAFGTIFLFRRRVWQMRLTGFASILLIGYYVVLATFVWMSVPDAVCLSLNWTVCLPFVGLVLNYLAIRAIGKDEMLVKAYDRLR